MVLQDFIRFWRHSRWHAAVAGPWFGGQASTGAETTPIITAPSQQAFFLLKPAEPSKNNHQFQCRHNRKKNYGSNKKKKKKTKKKKSTNQKINKKDKDKNKNKKRE